MPFITIDGDDIGQKITSYYLNNDVNSLSALNQQMSDTTYLISAYLREIGFEIIFCGADGVAGRIDKLDTPDNVLYENISRIGEACARFSAGIGDTLRESYIALVLAKSNGKGQLKNYRDMDN